MITRIPTTNNVIELNALTTDQLNALIGTLSETLSVYSRSAWHHGANMPEWTCYCALDLQRALEIVACRQQMERAI